MTITNPEELIIVPTTKDDFHDILMLFDQAMELQGRDGYKVWRSIDTRGLERDIENKLQYKILRNNDILCVFSIQYNDPLIWRDRDRDDAIYLHRIVANQNFKSQRQFGNVLRWAKQFASNNHLKYLRMDTWADNEKLIAYYMSFGFKFIGTYKTTNSSELPVQNRNLNVALLELELNDYVLPG